MNNQQHPLPIIETHAHLVIYEGNKYPNGFAHWIADNEVGFFILDNGLKMLIPGSNDKLDRLAQFLRSNRDKNWKSKYTDWKREGQWSSRTKMVVLTVNMAHMGCGTPKKTFGEACAELERLRQEFPENIIPFFHYDCRSGNAYDLFKYYVVGIPGDPNSGQWGGVKFYNSMGTDPRDPRYNKMYDDLERIGKPIIAHCTYSNPIHFMGPRKELKQLLGDRYDPKASIKENCDKFTDPGNIMEVMRNRPGLVVDLAHFGGSNMWQAWLKNPDDQNNLVNVIINGMKELPNLYGDFSYTLNSRELWGMFNSLFHSEDFPFLKERFLFGTDWDMTKTEISLKQQTEDFRLAIGEDTFNQVARINPDKFLYEKVRQKRLNAFVNPAPTIP